MFLIIFLTSICPKTGDINGAVILLSNLCYLSICNSACDV